MSLDRHLPAERGGGYATWPRKSRASDYLRLCHGALVAPRPSEAGALAVIETDMERWVVWPIPGDRERVRVEVKPRRQS